MIHVSDLINYSKCQRLSWNRAHKKIPFRSFYHMNTPYSQIWKDYLHFQNVGNGQVGDTNERTLHLLKEHDYVYNARFEYRGCRVRIPVLVKLENGFKAIYPYLSAFPKESEAMVMKVNRDIAAKCGISIVEHEIIYLNKDYVRQEVFDGNQCLLRSHCLFNRKNKLAHSIEEYMERISYDLDRWIDETTAIIEMENQPETKRSKTCTAGRRCIYYDTCFDETDQPDDSILFLTTSRNKIDAYHQGIQHVYELPEDQLDGFRLQYSQMMASRKQAPFIDRAAIQVWLQKITYPVSYLDFEWDIFAIPPYKGMKPFDVLCFQYSLHIEDSDGSLRQVSFFDTNDCREAFIQSLLKEIPKSGSILVYNMAGAEQLRLIQLSEQFPKYKEELKQIWTRMVDLSKPFEAGLFYDNKMRGHYSLKNVLPAFSDTYSYTELDIKNGLNAVDAYRLFDKSDIQKQEEIRKNIEQYCQMDTFAEYIVYHGLKNLTEENGACQI